MKNLKETIGFIGAGNMATALISGLINSDQNASKIIASSPEQEHLEKLSKDFGIKTCLLYTSPSPRDLSTSRMPSSA